MKKSHDNVIDLGDFRAKESKVFTGRDRGAAVRNASRLDALLEEYDTVRVVIPEQISSINPSFFEELFVNAVLKFKRDGFYNRVFFDSQGEYEYARPLNEAIERILRNRSAID